MEICSDSQVGNWEFANTLGEGAYGEVKLALNTKTSETRAVKIISLNLLNDKTAIQKEVLIHKTLNHENVIKYFQSFQQLDKFYIILEYASGGELFDRIEPDFGMNNDLAHKYFCQLVNGVEYLHSKGIVHRDIKPENLLLNDLDHIKIADFGLATLFQYRGNERMLTSPCGTAPYVAPEVLSKSEYKAQPTDIWSCGIVLVAMLAGELPWDKPVIECPDFVAWIKNNSYQKTPWCKIENSALSLMRNILTYDPLQRFTIRQIKSCTWFTRMVKNKPFQPVNALGQSGGDMAFLSQPTYFYGNDSTNTPSALGPMCSELEVTDSQANCECSQMNQEMTLINQNSAGHNFESFSQPITYENGILNSQFQNSQFQNSQFQNSQFSSQIGSQLASASQSPLVKLVKRLTRMFVHLNADACTDELKKLFHKNLYDYKVNVTNQRQRQITVTTNDKRGMILTFKVNIIEMNCKNEVLLDFRLSKGDGLEFKKIFTSAKNNLKHVACKRYVFGTNKGGCCDKIMQ